jgi:ectoine hydroxylase-related dioxygenase (phytanoyl-CoA dioxygenase family)
MSPHHSVTVWLAFTDVDEENGAMKIVPGSHTGGVIEHQRHDPRETNSVLTLELATGTFRADTAVPLCLRAGEVSMHDDRAVHSSQANMSDRTRAGLAIRYSGTDVKNDLSVNPYFKAFLMRGTDRYHHNPEGAPPTERFGRPQFKAVSIEEAGKM